MTDMSLFSSPFNTDKILRGTKKKKTQLSSYYDALFHFKATEMDSFGFRL